MFYGGHNETIFLSYLYYRKIPITCKGVRQMPELQRTKEIDMLTIQYEQEIDGRWVAYIPEIPGVITIDKTKEGACKKAKILAFKVMLDNVEHGESAIPSIQIFQAG